MNENRKIVKIKKEHLLQDKPCPICESDKGYFSMSYRVRVFKCKNTYCEAMFWQSNFDIDEFVHYVR